MNLGGNFLQQILGDKTQINPFGRGTASESVSKSRGKPSSKGHRTADEDLCEFSDKRFVRHLEDFRSAEKQMEDTAKNRQGAPKHELRRATDRQEIADSREESQPHSVLISSENASKRSVPEKPSAKPKTPVPKQSPLSQTPSSRVSPRQPVLTKDDAGLVAPEEALPNSVGQTTLAIDLVPTVLNPVIDPVPKGALVELTAPVIDPVSTVAQSALDLTSAEPAVKKPGTSLGTVVAKSNPDAAAPPIILIKAQVTKLAGHLQILGVVSPNPTQISDSDFAQRLAIEIYGLIDAIAKVARQFESSPECLQGQSLVIALPIEAQKPLELLTELQNILDADSFAALLGNLPKLISLSPEQETDVQRQLQTFQPAEDLGGKQSALFVLLQLQELKTTPILPSATNKLETLPEWLAEAEPIATPTSYAPAKSLPADLGQVSDTVTWNDGGVLRQKLNYQAAQYMQTQRHTLPMHLQALSRIPALDSADYAAWVQKVAQIVHQANFTPAVSAGQVTVMPSVYVFEDPEVMRLLQMLPISTLRDVVRGAGQLSRRVAAQSTLVHSQGVIRGMQTQTQNLHQSHTHESPRTGGASQDAGVIPEKVYQQTLDQEQTHPVSDHGTLPKGVAKDPNSTSLMRGLTTAVPTTHNRASERDIRAMTGKRPALAPSRDQHTERKGGATDTRRVVFDAVQQRLAEVEPLHQGQVQSFESVDNAALTQKLNAQFAAQAARNQHQEQVARIAKHIRTQITMQVLRQAQVNAESVELQLNPRRLGKMEVRISREVGGKITINFVVENPEALEVLRNSANSLLQSLREAGVNADRGTMNFMLKEENRQAFEQKQKKNTVPGLPEDEEDSILEIGQLADIDADGHVNVRV